jgi:hypothetical protein
MKDVSLDVPTVTRHALGDLPAAEVRLLRLTHAAPGSQVALDEEIAAIQAISQLVGKALASEPTPQDEFRLTDSQRDKISALTKGSPSHNLPRPASLASSPKQNKKNDALLALRTTAWTLGAAAAVVALLLVVRTPEDKAASRNATAREVPAESFNGKFTVVKPKESPKREDSNNLARKAPNQIPGLKAPDTTELAPAAPTDPNLPQLTDRQPDLPNRPSMKEAMQPPRGPHPVAPEARVEENKAFAAPK